VKPVRAGIALGSNLGNRLANLRAAIDALRGISETGEPFLEAPIYQTEPRFCPPGSPDFLNTVVEFGYGGSPLELLASAREIETGLGRTRSGLQNEPRVIDVDLLYLGDLVHDDADLELPHPRIGERRFVLQPLAEIRPELRLPGHERTVSELLDGLPGEEAPLVVLSEAD
jgi:2-amino-4-hydroxy-6-hydroxymethyldihydropteridine diphosphokinase